MRSRARCAAPARRPAERCPVCAANGRDVEDATAGQKKKKRRKKKEGAGVGRKPVCDFTVGQSYDGTVKYLTAFAAFIDIGCHRDGMCHVSRVADEYVGRRPRGTACRCRIAAGGGGSVV